MSGGVDSAVSAAILMRAGYEVLGVTCVFVDDELSRASARDAAAVCERLQIEHRIIDCTAQFESEVVTPFVASYAAGLTPSPCVGCNAACKVPSLVTIADELGFEMVSTGHYARVAQLSDNERFVIKTALDPSKDQSYMLGMLSQNQLSRFVLPLGAITKTEVRVFAQELKLPVANKEDSQDICFIRGSYTDFLTERAVPSVSGPIVDKNGSELGRHKGLQHYTLGQRKGIGVGGSGAPYYVIEKRGETNELVVGFSEETYMDEILVESVNWQAFSRLEGSLECSVKVRYRSKAVACVIEPSGETSARVRFMSPQPITSPGQYAVFYLTETLLGAATIASVCLRDK